MRAYLQSSNLVKAMGLGGGVTVMALPRLLQGGDPAWLYVVIAFLCLTLVAGAATAWGSSAGMVGLFPRGRRRVAGLVAGGVAGVVLLPFLVLWFDPWLREALVCAGDATRVGFQFPDTAWTQVAIVLWAAGFQVLFFEAATMSFFCRLTRRWLIALTLAVAFRVFVGHLQLEGVPVGSPPAFFFMHGVTSAIGCILFSCGGLPSASLFAAVLAARHFWAGSL